MFRGHPGEADIQVVTAKVKHPKCRGYWMPLIQGSGVSHLHNCSGNPLANVNLSGVQAVAHEDLNSVTFRVSPAFRVSDPLR